MSAKTLTNEKAPLIMPKPKPETLNEIIKLNQSQFSLNNIITIR